MAARSIPGSLSIPEATRPRPGQRPSSSLPPTTIVDRLGLFFLGCFLFVFYSRVTDFWGYQLHLPLLTSSMAMLFAVLSMRFLLAFKTTAGILMTMLTFWFMMSIPFSYFRMGSLGLFSDLWLKSASCFVLMVALCTRSHHVRLMVHLLGWSIFVTAMLALQFGILIAGRLAMPRGLLGGTNELSGVMLIGFLCWVNVLLDPLTSPVYRVVAGLVQIPILLALVKTGSRGTLITAVVVSIFLFIRLSVMKKLAIGAMLIVAILMASLFVKKDVLNRFTTVFDSSDGAAASQAEGDIADNPTGSTEGRLHLLRRSLLITALRPFTGVGMGQFPDYEDLISRQEGQRKGSWLGTHNTYTQISSETGIPGLVIFIVLLTVCYRRIAQMERDFRGGKTREEQAVAHMALHLRALMLAYFIFFIFDHTAYMPFWPTSIGLVTALAETVRREFGNRVPNAARAVRPPGANPNRFGNFPALPAQAKS